MHRSKKRLFDHLVGGHLNGHGHIKAKRLCRLEIEHGLEFGGLHHRQVGGLLAFENTADVDARLDAPTPTSNAPAPRCTSVAKAFSMLRSLLTSKVMSRRPIAAAACTSTRSGSVSGLFGYQHCNCGCLGHDLAQQLESLRSY
jgi:hypothetical protein